jgi:hypothetical protein
MECTPSKMPAPGAALAEAFAAAGACDAWSCGGAGRALGERIEKLSATANANSRAKERPAACHVWLVGTETILAG